MPDRRRHRGPGPQDRELFAAEQLPRLRQAAAEYGWLLDRGYPETSALELVGNRHQLVSRQREALFRSCIAQDRIELANAHLAHDAEELWIDGYNVLVTIEAALSGGVVLACRDGVYRDLASVHGSYRRVEATEAAIHAVHSVLPELGVGRFLWLLDQPVGNSGRLAAHLRQAMERLSPALQGDVRLDPNPDALLVGAPVAASADRAVLAAAPRWLPLARLVVERRVPSAWVLRLTSSPTPEDSS